MIRLQTPIDHNITTLAPGRYLVNRGQLGAFRAAMAAIGATEAAFYNYSGPSRMLAAYTDSHMFALRMFEDGGLDWLEISLAGAQVSIPAGR